MSKIITIDRSVVEKALEALYQAREHVTVYTDGPWQQVEHNCHAAITAFKAALAEPDPEPMATFDEVWDAIDWDKWRKQPIRDLVRMIHSKTSPRAAPQPQDEPVAFAFRHSDGSWHDISETEHSAGMTALYTHPAQQRQPLTDEEIRAIAKAGGWDGSYQSLKFARAVERAHGIGGRE